MTECIQQIHGPTPCFRESGAVFSNTLPCGLSFCPVADYLDKNQDVSPWTALHTHCVITDPFDYRGDYKSIQLSFIINNKKN